MENEITFLVFINTAKAKSVDWVNKYSDVLINKINNLVANPIEMSFEGKHALIFSDLWEEVEIEVLIEENKAKNLHVVFHETEQKNIFLSLLEKYPEVKMVTQSHVPGNSFYDRVLSKLFSALTSQNEVDLKEAVKIGKSFFDLDPILDDLISEWVKVDFSDESIKNLSALKQEKLMPFM